MGWGKGTIIVSVGGGAAHVDETAKIKEAAVMALSDGLRTIEEIEQMEVLLQQNWQRMERKVREDAEACSEERSFTSEDGSTWQYVTVHDEYVRIIGCTTEVETLIIPAQIEGLPVAELAVDACSNLDSVREAICPDGIEKMGHCVFRNCKNLEKLVLPRGVDEYDSSWVRACKKLRELVLPGMLARVAPDIFEEGDVRVLKLGVGTYDFIPGAFARSNLESISIDEENPYISTDGQAVFAHDGTHLRMLALSCDEYTVPDGCLVIEKKAFANRAGLHTVKLPDSVTTIEDHAFSYSGLERFDAPQSLQSIGERAFFRCRKLASVKLNESLVSIGDEAFTGTAITSLHIPSTLERLGMNVADKTGLHYVGAGAGFSIEPKGILEMDAQGGLYRHAADGLHFVRMLDESCTQYAVKAGAVEIDPMAFTKLESINKVDLPEGLLRIGKAAFRDARNLVIADFPSTLQEVGDEAFLNTSLCRVHIPRGLTVLGDSALITHGAHSGNDAPSLMIIEADPGNERFYSVPCLLIERHENAGSHVVVYADNGDSVVVPDDVTVIDKYAFGGARNLHEMRVSNRVRQVDMRGMSIECCIEHLYIDLVEPIEGHEYFDLHFPDTERSAHELQLAFNLSSSVHVNNILKHYDSAILNMHGFDRSGNSADEEVDVYEQARLIIDRLRDPVLMTGTNKTMLTQCMVENTMEICEAIARHDDRKAIDDLLELGILNKDNLLDIIDRIGKLQDAAMTGYLLEVKRRLFAADAIDFDL